MQGIPTLPYDARNERNGPIHHLQGRRCRCLSRDEPINVHDTSVRSLLVSDEHERRHGTPRSHGNGAIDEIADTDQRAPAICSSISLRLTAVVHQTETRV